MKIVSCMRSRKLRLELFHEKKIPSRMFKTHESDTAVAKIEEEENEREEAKKKKSK